MAWRNLARHKRRSALTAVAMALVIAMSMMMGSMMAGMAQNMTEAIVDRSIGHVHLNHKGYPETISPYDAVPDATATLAALRARPDVKAATGRLNAFGLFSKDAGHDGIAAGEHLAEGVVGGILGTDLTAEAELTRLDDRLTRGTYLPAPGEDSVLIGYRLAQELKVDVGARLVIVAPALDGSTGNVILPVRGVFNTGTNRMDKSVVLDLARAQELTVQGDQVHELVVVTQSNERANLEAFVASAKSAWPDLAVRPWWEIQPEVVEMMAMSDGFNQLFILVVMAVAAFGVINTLLMSVYERTRELGVMRAIGMRPGQIVRLVLTESLMLASLAAVLGVALGGLIDLYMLKVGVHLAVADGEGYQVSGITLDPVLHGAIRAQDILLPTAALFIVAAIGALWPALRAARLDPITAIRQD